MDSEPLAVRNVTPDASSGTKGAKVSSDPSRRQHYQATSPTTGQTHAHSSPGKRSLPGGTESRPKEDTKPSESNDSDSERAPVSTVMPKELYPLPGFLRTILAQEKTLWERNEILLKSLKSDPSRGDTPVSELDPPSDGTSLKSGSTTSTSSTVKEDTDHTKETLYFIRYGQLTGAIHKYFRKLEKRHACLHLTARRAKHETIRHVDRTVTGKHSMDLPPVATPTLQQASAAIRNNQIVVLREDELPVYRCALMCSQFPMLSAPSPPDGQSPTPPPPPLPSVFTTDTLTAPSGYQDEVNVPGGLQGAAQDSSITGSKQRPRLASTSSLTSPDARSTDSVDGGGRPHPPPHNKPSAGAGPHLGASEPIPIRGGKTRAKSKSIKRHSGIADGTDSSSLAKLPPGDSDEEVELVKLMASSGSESSPTGREHPFSPMVNRDMLYCLVRCAFRQTEEQQVNFESSLKREYGRRSKGEILAKELAGQLQVLDNNAHPFYKPKLFVTRNGYDLWLQSEKEKVRKLIDKFWHCSLPRPQLWRNFNPTDYHHLYCILLRKIIDCESRTDRKEPVHSGKTPSSPLSPTAQRLLTEFGLRYGVGELYRRIVYLEYLAKHFDYEIWYIKHCTEELRSIRALLPRNRNRITAVRPEMEILRATVHLLHGQTDNSLTRIDRLFLDSDPRKGVASLIELLAEVLDAQQNLFGKRVQPVEKWLKRYLKSGFILRYERRKEIASDETVGSQTVQPFVLTPTLVNSLLLDTRDEVYEFRDKFQSVFRPYFDVVPFSKVEFYRLLCADACSLSARICHKESTHKFLRLEMLGLMYRLNERDIEWQGVIEPEHQLWRQHFQNLACIWLEILGNQINQWTIGAVEEDQWTLLAFDAASPSPSSVVASHASHSQTAHPPSSSWQGMPTRNTHILSSIRISPFPSPPVPEGAFNPRTVIGGGRLGAFTPYRHVVKRQKSSPVSSESSGAVTDSLAASCQSPMLETSSATSITGEMPRLLYGARKKNTPVSIVTFGQRKRVDEVLTSSEVVLPSHEIEVAASVYSGSDEEREGQEVGQDDKKEEVEQGEGQGEGQEVGQDDKKEEVEQGEGQEETVDAAEPPETISQSGGSMYVSCVSKVDSVEPHPHQGPGSHASQPTGTLRDNLETSAGSNRTLTTEHAQTTRNTEIENGSTGQLPAMGPDDPSATQCTKFNNLLDKCDAGEPDIVRPKPRVASNPHPSHSHQSGTFPQPGANPAHHEPGTYSAHHQPLGFPEQTRTRTETVSSVDMTLGRDTHLQQTTSPELSPSPPGDMLEDPGPMQSFLFPVSNSPMDVICMLSRLASFTGELLTVLTPKIRKTNYARNNKLVPTDEFSPEVNKARQQASERQKNARNIKTVFLKKLNKILICSLKLYADNLLCMDLCGWGMAEAVQLLGEQNLHHLNRRKDSGEIWGCRHMVEARHGMHPGGIPCSKKQKENFEHITRDMCIRINNIHILITVFHSLEDHLYSKIRTDSKKPISAFGYVSSDHSETTPNVNLLRSRTNKPHPTRTRPNPNSTVSTVSHFISERQDTTSMPSSVSTGLGPMEPDHWETRQRGSAAGRNAKGNKEAEDAPDAPPRQSQECLDHLRKAQEFQVKMMAIRMNKFCKVALSELLGLRLNDCSIEKRLQPVVDYLERHRVALQKYVYPECFSAIMENVWECLLQDLEDEAVRLRASKRPITNKAQMLLQTLAHLIQFMHNKSEGIEIDTLNSTSEYLQGLLDIMTRSTNQLINIFNKLNTAHFSRNVLDLSQAPVVVDSHVLSQLRLHLRSNKKCFTGKQFVRKVMEIGRGALAEAMDVGSASSNPHVMGPTGQAIEYNEEYAISMAQYLLDEGILIHVSQMPFVSDGGSSVLLTPDQPTDEDDLTSHVPSSYEVKELTDSVRPLGVNSAVSMVSGASVATSATDSPGQGRHSRRSRGNSTTTQEHYQYRPPQNSRQHLRLDRPTFVVTSSVFYKFAGSEDAEFAFFQSQVLMSSFHLSTQSTSSGLKEATLSSSRRSTSGILEESSDFTTARQGTICLVYDLLSQRARKERVAKQFLSSPRVQEQRRQAGNTHCDLIFKM